MRRAHCTPCRSFACVAISQKIAGVPKRHADNLVTELQRHAVHLLMHARMVAAVAGELRWWRVWAVLVNVALVLGLAGALYGVHVATLHNVSSCACAVRSCANAIQSVSRVRKSESHQSHSNRIFTDRRAADGRHGSPAHPRGR